MSENGRLWLIGAIVAIVVIGGAILLFTGGSDDDTDTTDGSTTSTTVADEESTTTVGEDTTTSTADETTTSEAEETTTTAAEDTTTSTVNDEEDTLNAITVDIDGEFIVFPEVSVCALGADYAGSITAEAEDGTTFEAVLDGAASTVEIDGPAGTYDAAVTNLSNNPTILTLLAEPPEMEVSVVLGFCDQAP